ncbi:hypothetical protein CPC08DRAFT_714227 [Agrocybe pediades]|nr:hypothetical protein CPC08DRAFT_714227 [Agrocybe pediades]
MNLGRPRISPCIQPRTEDCNNQTDPYTPHIQPTAVRGSSSLDWMATQLIKQSN